MPEIDTRAIRAGWVAPLLLALLTVLLASSSAAETIGSIATLEGDVQIGRDAVWAPAAAGTEIVLADEVRTGRPGRARIAFRDDSVLNIGEESHVVIDEQVFDPEQGTYDSVVRLLRGKVRALISDYYREPTARYELQTETSVSGIRGTEFILVYDPERKVTEVVGISGEVAVRSVLIPVGETVYIRAKEITTVARGQYPSPARQLEDEEFRQYLEGLQFIGLGGPESSVAGNPLIGGAAVPPPDRAEPLTASIPPGSDSTVSILGGPTGGTVPGDDPSAPDVGALIGQPPAAVEPASSGNVGIPF